jgi:hypothetical protein
MQIVLDDNKPKKETNAEGNLSISVPIGAHHYSF